MHSLRFQTDESRVRPARDRGLRVLLAGECADELRDPLASCQGLVETVEHVREIERARLRARSGSYDVAFVRAELQVARDFGPEAERAGLTWVWVRDPGAEDALAAAGFPAVGAAATINEEDLALGWLGGPGGEQTWLALLLQSVSERLAARAQHDDLVARFDLVAAGSRDGLWEWDLASDRLRVSDRWLEMLGLERDEEREDYTARADWFDRISPDDLSAVETAIREHLEGVEPHFECEARLRHADGSWRWVACRGKAAKDSTGQATEVAGSLTDVSVEKLHTSELARRALYDDLTGLPGRALFLDRVSHCLSRARRQGGREFALLFLDLDRFKQINDTWGHRAGDRLLVAAARRIEYCVRPGDTAARIAGDEFAVLLEDIADTEDAIRVVERLSKELAAPFGLGEGQVQLTASIGLVRGSARFESPEDLLSEADGAMYRAKRAGAGRFAFVDGRTPSAVPGATLEEELRGALRNREFRLAYQPVYRLDTGALSGFEALLRWDREEHGTLDSRAFIHAAEHAGLLHRLGPWALTRAARDLHALRSRYPAAHALEISLNVSVAELARPDFVREVDSALQGAGLDAKGLLFEIPELALKQWSPAGANALNSLVELGFGLCIDDFGTEGSAIPLLAGLPVTSLKLAAALVADNEPMPSAPRALRERHGRESGCKRDGRLLKALVALAHDLELAVTAKGIERQEQLARVRALGCERAQGYLLGRPVAAEDLATWVGASAAL